MNHFDAYKRIFVLSGGNFDRKNIMDLNVSNAVDDDLVSIVSFRKAWLFKYYAFNIYQWFSIVTGTISLIVSAMTAIIPQLKISLTISNMIFFVSCLAYVLSYIVGNRPNSMKNSVIHALKSKDTINDDKKLLKRFVKILQAKFPLSADSYWKVPEGHVSDAQIIPYLMARTQKNVSLLYAGKPYYEEYFADSIILRVIDLQYNNPDEVEKQTGVLKKILKAAYTNQRILYYYALGKENEERIGKDTTYERNPYVFGISFLSKFFHDIYFHYNKRGPDQSDRYLESDRPIGIHLGQKLKDGTEKTDVANRMALYHLLFAALCSEYVKLFDSIIAAGEYIEEYKRDGIYSGSSNIVIDERQADAGRECCIHIEIVDIIQMINPFAKERGSFHDVALYRKTRYKEYSGYDFLRIPVKRPLVLAKRSEVKANSYQILPSYEGPISSNKDSHSSDFAEDRVMVLVMGGAEQNFALQSAIVRQSWEADAEFHYRLFENAFARSTNDFYVSSENLVHTFYKDEDIVRKDIRAEENGLISAHIYPMKINNDDYIGVYGYNALSTKIVAMCTVKCLTTSVAEQESDDSKGYNSAATISKIRKMIEGDVPFLIQVYPIHTNCTIWNLLDMWDREDIINNHERFDEFFGNLKFKVRM